MDISKKDKININGSKVTVLGIGRSGIGAARLAKHFGATVFISDAGTKDIFKENLITLSKENIEGEYGGHSDRIYDTDLMVVSPGVPNNAPSIIKALENNIPVVGEIEFGSWFTSDPIVSVTGSNGKTTTVYALLHMFNNSSLNPTLAGNMGKSFSEAVLEDLIDKPENRIYILEISSFQMEFIQHFKPFVAVFLNITPDHLDRHGSMHVYMEAKFKMAMNLESDGIIIYNSDDGLLVEQYSSNANSIPFGFTSDDKSLFSIKNDVIINQKGQILFPVSDISLPGKHNLSNLLAAATAASISGIEDQNIVISMREFQGVQHRMEQVCIFNGAVFVNDSKATNVDAVKVALESYSQPIILLLGGKDKKGDFKELIPLTHNIHYILAFGKARDVIATALVDAVRLQKFASLKIAVAKSKELARPGDIVLLSPGCASFDEFNNFEERGNYFKKWVNQDMN